MLHVIPSNPKSSSARVLAKEIDRSGIRARRKMAPREGDRILFWGLVRMNWPLDQCLNRSDTTEVLVNKVRFFQEMPQELIPAWSTDREKINELGWRSVVVRHKISSHSGEGIEIVPGEGPIPAAPLYTKYINKDREYRLHMGRLPGEDAFSILHCQQKVFKKKHEGDAPLDWKVRTHSNGFIFDSQDEGVVPEPVKGAALLLSKQLRCNLVALDIILNEKSGRAYVLEGNTASGLETATPAYVQFIRRWYNK